MSNILIIEDVTIAIKIDRENKRFLTYDIANGNIVENTESVLTVVGNGLALTISEYFKLSGDELVQYGLKKDCEIMTMAI